MEAVSPQSTRSKKSPKQQALATSRELFIEALRRNGGVVTPALKEAGLDRKTAYNYFKSDEAFSQAWLDALEVGHDELYIEARRRAVVDKSDTLLIFLLKQGENQKKWRNRIIQTGNIALETVRQVGEQMGLTHTQVEKIQSVMTERFDKVQLI